MTNRSSSIGPASVVVRAKDVISCELDGETAMLNIRSGIYYGLDEVGAAIWRKVSQSCVVREIVRDITAQYEVDPPQCQSDVVRLLNELADNGLLEIDDGSAG